jgi:hypothetical protein
MPMTSDGAPPDRNPGLDLKDVVGLYLNQVSTQYALWSAFLVGVFASGGLAVSKQLWQVHLAGAVAFLIFAAGHGYLIYQSLQLKRAASLEVGLHLDRNTGLDSPALARIARTARPAIETRYFLILHVAVDLCILILFAIHPNGSGPPNDPCLNTARTAPAPTPAASPDHSPRRP